MSALHELSVAEAGALLRRREITSTELTDHALRRIAALDDVVHAFVLVTEERARADAARADAEIAAGLDRGPLHGIPYALKDVYATAGIATTCHSRLMLDNVPAEDAFVEARAREGGGVLLGKLATHEFAIGGPSFDLPFPPATNPWNAEHFTGGSSSGSAAAVAAGYARVAFGSDTSGSIRGPACYSGTVGLKPTYGLVSRRGTFPLSYTLDHCGPLSWTVEDAALALRVVAGFDPGDPSSADVPLGDVTGALGAGVEGLRIGYPRHLAADATGVSSEVLAALDAAAETLASLGATVEEVRLPDLSLFSACGRVIMTAEAFAIHEAALRTRPRDFGRYTFQRVAIGATISAADLVQAYRLRRELTVRVGACLRRYDALVAAVALAPAPRLDEFPADWPLTTPMQAIHFSVTGNPALALPIGFSASGLPLGMQVVGRAFDEPTVFRVAAAYEAAAGVRARRPALP